MNAPILNTDTINIKIPVWMAEYLSGNTEMALRVHVDAGTLVSDYIQLAARDAVRAWEESL